MLDLKFVRANPDAVRQSLEKRGSAISVDEFTELDARRRALTTETETLKAERNKAGGEIGRIKREGGDASEIMEKMGRVASRIKAIDQDLKDVEAAEHDWLVSVPNTPHESVPAGASEEDNVEVRRVGQPPQFSFEAREHWQLGADLGCLDLERAARIAGARFAVLTGPLARLERALTDFMLDVQTREHGYLEVVPPYIVNTDSLMGTGQLPKFEEDLFKLTDERGFYLIPTAEVPLTNLHRDETLAHDELPRRYCAFTPCFRSEAGSYGKDTKGLIRQHQFHKVELVRFERPGDSYDALEEMTGHAEEILKRLGLAYRTIVLCTGDMGFSATKTYDIEVWLPGQGKYREISSCSNTEDFQARRAGIRYRPEGAKKSVFAHTLNGSGLAVGRTLVAVLENGQQQDGSVVIPEALRPYMGGLDVIRKP